MKYGMTPRMKRVYDYIATCGDIGPTYDEIMQACDIKSKSNVYEIVKGLHRREAIEWIPGLRRSIKIKSN
jgi:SOS-response transcriptional repressor LexA